MAKAAVVFVLLLAIILGGLYVLLYQPQQQALEEAEREASLRAQEGSTLRSRVADLEDMLDKFRQTSAELEAEVKQKEEELEGMRATQDELLGELEQEIANGQIQIERLRGQLRVDMVDEILFDSGEAAIKPEGADVLRRVGAVLKKAEDRHVVVQRPHRQRSDRRSASRTLSDELGAFGGSRRQCRSVSTRRRRDGSGASRAPPAFPSTVPAQRTKQ